MRVLRGKVPSADYDLNDEQAARRREGGDTVWNETAKDRPLPARATARRDNEAAGTPAELAAQTGFPAPRHRVGSRVGLTMTRDQGEHGPRWHEGYQLGLRDGLTGGMTCICGGGPETLEMVDGYWTGREASLQQRDAAPEAGS